MEWSDLRVFLAVARAGTLGAAARGLGVSQPTAGRRLRALEEAVGHVLSQRTADGFVLTDEGNAVLGHAERLLHVSYAVYARTGSEIAAGGGGAGLRVVTMDTAFAEMPDALWLKRLLPEAQVAMRSNSREVQAEFCRQGIGLAVLPRPLGDRIPGIAPVDLGEAPPGRDTYVGCHRDLRRLGSRSADLHRAR